MDIRKFLCSFLTGAAVSFSAFGIDLTLSPSESLFWSTPADRIRAVNIFWPPDAASAKLVVVDGKRAVTNVIEAGTASVTLDLAAPASPAEERTVDLELRFYDSADVECVEKRRTSRLGLVCTGSQGDFSRFVPPDAAAWEKGHAVAGKSVLLPVPATADDAFLPCRWSPIAPIPDVPTRFSFADADGVELCSAVLWRLCKGLQLILR